MRHVTVRFGENPDAHESGPHVARVVADLLPAERRDAPLDAVRSAWREAVGQPADVISLLYTEPAIGPGGRAIELRLLGPDLEVLKRASGELLAYLGGFAGVQDLTDDLRPGKREFRLRLKPAAGTLGIDAQRVAEQLRAAFEGIEIDAFTLGRETYEVDLRVAAADRSGLADLERFTVTTADGAQVPLSIVAEIKPVRGWARIHRIDGQRAVTIQGDVDRAVANARELVALTRSGFVPELLERYGAAGPALRVSRARAASRPRPAARSCATLLSPPRDARAARAELRASTSLAFGLLLVPAIYVLQFRIRCPSPPTPPPPPDSAKPRGR